MFATKTLRAAPALLADDALATVAGGCGHHHRHHPCGGSSTSQTNSVGDVTIYAPNNSGTIIVDINQSNSAGK